MRRHVDKGILLRLLMGNERYDDRQHFEQIVLLDRPNLATTVNGDRQTDRKKETTKEREHRLDAYCSKKSRERKRLLLIGWIVF